MEYSETSFIGSRPLPPQGSVLVKTLKGGSPVDEGKLLGNYLTNSMYRDILIKSFVERYRSGHNGGDSKSVRPKGLVGSNPTRSATMKSRTVKPFIGLPVRLFFFYNFYWLSDFSTPTSTPKAFFVHLSFFPKGYISSSQAGRYCNHFTQSKVRIDRFRPYEPSRMNLRLWIAASSSSFPYQASRLFPADTMWVCFTRQFVILL